MGGTCGFCKHYGWVSINQIRTARTSDQKRIIKLLRIILSRRNIYKTVNIKGFLFVFKKINGCKHEDDFDELEFEYIKYMPGRIAHNFDKTKNRLHHSTRIKLAYRKNRLRKLSLHRSYSNRVTLLNDMFSEPQEKFYSFQPHLKMNAMNWSIPLFHA